MLKARFLLISLLCITQLMAQKKSSIDETFSTKDFTIKYPQSWTLDTSGLMGTQLILFSEQEDDADLFRENVNLVKQNISEYNLGFDEYVKLSESQIQNYITNLDGFQSKRNRSDSGEFHEFIYTGQQGSMRLFFHQYFYHKDGMIYLLTFTSDIAKVDQYASVGQAILDKFKLN